MTLHSRDDVDRLYVLRREGERALASIEDSVDTLIQLEDDKEKCGGRLITATRSDTNNTRTSGMTITRKQKWEEKLLDGCFKQLTSNISHKKTWTGLRKGKRQWQ